MSAHRYPGPKPTTNVPPAPPHLVPAAPEADTGTAAAGAGAAERAVVERHADELERDGRVERMLTWRELGCLLFVALFLLVRARYLT
jgi:hypothetical protein